MLTLHGEVMAVFSARQFTDNTERISIDILEGASPFSAIRVKNEGDTKLQLGDKVVLTITKEEPHVGGK